MRLLRIGAADARFRTVTVTADARLNLIVSDKTRAVGQGDSRNGTGKTELANIVRFLLGGNRPSTYKDVPELAHFEFQGRFLFPGRGGESEIVSVRRALDTTKVWVEGWSCVPESPLGAREWASIVGTEVLLLDEAFTRPTVGQLLNQFIRPHFSPTKVYPTDSDWETGCRYAFLLGIDPRVAAGAGEHARLDKQQKVLGQAAKDGALSDLKLDIPALQARLAAAKDERARGADALVGFRVEERYEHHQNRADELSTLIARLNEAEVILRRRIDNLERAISEEVPSEHGAELGALTRRIYEEAGVVFSDTALQRFQDVEAFQQSVRRNRRIFLQNELDGAVAALENVRAERGELGEERAGVMGLLEDSVALSTYRRAESSLLKLDAEIAGIVERLKIAEGLENIATARDEQAIENKRRMRAEIREKETLLDEARVLFNSLTGEIYGASAGKLKSASLDLGVMPTSGGFLVRPKIAGDGSSGIASVETFVMDMVTMAMAARAGRSPEFLLHDSRLFDSVDSEQVASCLNVGARLAEEIGFQYIVTINSDTLRAAIEDSGDAFNPDPYLVPPRLSDATEAEKLFGFQF